MNETELKEYYINFLDLAYKNTVAEYANKGYVFDESNSSSDKARYSKVDMNSAIGTKAKVSRVLIEKNPEFTFEYFSSFVDGNAQEPITAFNIFTATHSLSLSELTESERSVIGLPSVKRIQERGPIQPNMN